MLKLDFSKILDNIKPTVTKSSPRAKNSKPKKAQKKQIVYATLGDPNRLAPLPDIVTEEFVALYSDSLEEILQPYVASKLLTLGYASRYRQALLENIFGSENHMGIFHYLKDKDLDGKTDKEIVLYSEQMILKGWQIRKEANQYWLVNGDLQRIIEMTGRAPLFKEVATLSFDESSAHVFLEDGVASKISALAKTLGHDADSLAATGNLDVLLARVSDDKFAGYVINYNALRRILKKSSRYNTIIDGVSMVDIYKEGYRLSSQLTFPFSEKAIFEKGETRYSMKAVEDDVNKPYMVNKYLLSSIAAKVKMDLLQGTKVVFPEVVEIKDFRNTIALMTELYPAEFSEAMFSETLDIINSVFSSKRSSGFSSNLMASISTLAVIDGLLLGNMWFSPSSFSVDSVSGKVFSNHSLDYFTMDEGVLDTLSLGEFGELSPESFQTFFSVTNPEVLSSMINSVPENVKTKIASYNLDLSSYPYQFEGIKRYFEKARKIIVG
jgi:hypothetical protein